MVKLSNVNLNLLVALDVLLREQNVTNAGNSLGITQSAMSNTLKQLRVVFGDKLFTRGQASKMIPTPFSASLRKPLDEFLNQANTVLTVADTFDPKTSTQTFRIGMSDLAELSYGAKLASYLKKHAPHVKLHIEHANQFETSSPFESREVDTMLGFFPELPQNIMSEELYDDEMIIVGQKGHPAMQKPLSLEEYVALPQILLVLHHNTTYHTYEKAIKQAELTRNVVAKVRHIMPMLFAIRESKTPLVGVVPKRAIDMLRSADFFSIQPSCVPVSRKKVQLVWHKITHDDRAHIWFRNAIKEITSDILAANSGDGK